MGPSEIEPQIVSQPRAFQPRPVRDDDAQELFGLLSLCFAEYPGCLVDPHDDLADLRAPGRAYPPPGGFWAVEDGRGRVAACVALDWPEPDVAELHRLYVRPDLSGRGIGRSLIGFGIDRARSAGAARLVLWSDTRFTRAHALYGRHRFTATGASRDLGDVSRSRETLYALELA